MIKLKNILYGLILFTTVFQIIKFYSFYLEYSDWQYADWLINYQGGFIRRGLTGEILFQIYNITNIKLDLLILLFVWSILFLIMFFLIKSLKYLNNSRLDTLIFLSPGFFIYPIMNSEIIGRKDILLFAAVGILVFYERNFKSKFLLLYLVTTIFYISLSHSGLLFYIPYLIFLFILIKINRNEKIDFREILIILIGTTFVLFFIYSNQGSKFQVIEICNSIKNFVLENCQNRAQFGWLSTPVEEHMKFKTRSNLDNYVLFYLVSLVLVFIFIGIKLFFSKFETYSSNLNKIRPLYILLVLFFLTLPVYILGYDWGRYISMSYYCSFFIYIFCIKKKMIIFDISKTKLKLNLPKYAFVFFVLIYTVGWTFPFYGANNFKLPLKKPIYQLYKILNK
tara:strand:+ start:175 stop:1359 length:1185 start_codon:yes stop_codon:yes gene_type:complete